MITLLVATLGSGLVLLGLSRSYALSLAMILGWGAIGGVTMALLRTLIQEHTPPAMMGRVIGLGTRDAKRVPARLHRPVVLVQATSLSSALVIAGSLWTIAVATMAPRPQLRQL